MPEEEKTFTQEQVNEIIQERLGREKSKFADYEDWKKKATDYESRLKAFEDAAKTERELEIEKAIKAARAETEKPLREELKRLQAENLRARFVGDNGVALLPGYRHLVRGETEDELKASLKAVQEQQAKDLDAAKIGAKTPAPNMGGGGGTGGSTTAESKAAESLTPEELNTCNKLGIKPEEYAQHKRLR